VASTRLLLAERYLGELAQHAAGNGFTELQPAGRLVSVVIPSFNHERYVGEAIRSVAIQRDRDIEIILLDDCSSDRTFDAGVAALEHQHLPYLAIRTRHHGAGFNFNTGVQVSYGGWIAALASDDRFVSGAIDLLAGLAEETGADAVFGSVDEINEDGTWKLSRAHSLETFAGLDPSARWTHVLERRSSVMLQGMLLSRAALSKVGMLATDVHADDYDFMLKLLKHELKCQFTAAVVAQHRQTRAALSLEQIDRYHDAARQVARRHARSVNELRRAVGVLQFEAGAGKVANGYIASGVVALLASFSLTPLRTSHLMVQRLTRRLGRSGT
jgi:GT2 family glycosyltransferase